MIAGLAFIGCSKDDGPDPGNGFNGEPQFLTVRVNATGSLSRAALEGNYEEGLGKENEVTSVRFYFFDASRNAAKVKGDNGDTYYDVAMSGSDKDMPNVEKILQATLVIQTPENDKEPAYIVAVVNPGPNLDDIEIKNIDDLNDVVADHSNTTSFIMSSSVYSNGTDKIEAVDVAGHLYPTAEAAKEDPVVIHVERVLAKARLTVGLIAADNGFYRTTADASEKYDGKEIYVKFLGWNVTATANTSRMIKEINPAWSNSLFGSTLLWNTADYYRSFWAVNPENMSYTWGNFTTDAQLIKEFDPGTTESPKVNYTYLQENASNDFATGVDPTQPSQIIIAAQLVDSEGNPMTFADYAGERTTIDGLIAKYAAASGLWKDTEGGKMQIEASDIELKTVRDLVDDEDAYKGERNRYKVYAQLTSAASSKTWYTSKAQNADPISLTAANSRLKALGGAKVWKNGYTYYYFDIQHFNGGSTENVKGKIGVVRNHIYAANIKTLTGLGTPVYDPDEIIYTEHPEDDDTFIAAEICILSWRIVPQDINLEW